MHNNDNSIKLTRQFAYHRPNENNKRTMMRPYVENHFGVGEWERRNKFKSK